MLAAASSTGVSEIAQVNSNCDASTVLGAITTVMAVASRLTQTGRALQLLSVVRHSLEHVHTDTHINAADRVGDLKTHVANLTQALLVKRHHTTSAPGLDPRFLVFECAASIVLRKRQVELINEFSASASGGSSCVRQMLMGEGKSSTVSPLLGLLLANGKQLVTVVVPQPLIEQAVSMLRQVLASVFGRRLTRFSFSRSFLGQDGDAILMGAEKLHKTMSIACEAGSIVITAGASIKALLVCGYRHPLPVPCQIDTHCIFIRHLSHREGCAYHPIQLKVVELMEAAVTRTDGWHFKLSVALPLRNILGLWSDGVALLDECDLLLHPFRSETNFPIHEKSPLAMMLERTEVAERLIDGFFAAEPGENPADATLRAAIHTRLEEGKHEKALQSIPHVVLADKEFYPHLLPALAHWLLPALRRKLEHKDALLVPIDSDTIQVWASSEREPSFIEYDKMTGDTWGQGLEYLGKTEHSVNSILDGEPSTFWCSKESKDRHNAAFVELIVTLGRQQSLGAIDVTFKARSSFLGKSGQSMLPSETTVLLSTAVEGTNIEKFVEVARTGEVSQQRVYLYGKPARHIKLRMIGPARWFAIEGVEVFEQLPDRRSEISSEQLHNYLTESPLRSDTASAVEAAVPYSSLQLLNISRDSLLSFLPHCISKINRVAFGLLPAAMDSPSESVTRKFMAIPFTGKDTPSAASEFSHPDILIVLTLLAYRHEGLRRVDMLKVVNILKSALKRERGPLSKRPSYRLFGRWLAAAPPTEGGITAAAVLPLELFDPADERQNNVLWSLLRRERDVVSFFVREFVFPECLHHKRKKISATGEELGGDALFRVRLGFSGTPSTLLPRSLGQCDFEPGTEGQIARVLSDPNIVSAKQFDDWSVKQLLLQIATASPPIHALIDTGAVITGLESLEVAALMLKQGLVTMTGVVYVNSSGAKVILTRGAHEPVPLDQSSVQPAHRFTFYDQHHTTGVDIAQAPTACAVVTVGKDSVVSTYIESLIQPQSLFLPFS